MVIQNLLRDDNSKNACGEIILDALKRIEGKKVRVTSNDMSCVAQALPHILTAGHQRRLRFVSIGALMRGAAEQVEST